MMDKLVADIRSAANALALNTPVHLGMPTFPPISWRQDGDQVIVILADGRKVSSSIQAINELMFSQGVGAGVPPALKPVQSPVPKVGADGVRPSEKPVMPRKRVVKK